MDALNRTITTQNNAHQTSTTLNPTSRNNTYTEQNIRQNNTKNNFERKCWSSTTALNLIKVLPNQIKQINIVLRS